MSLDEKRIWELSTWLHEFGPPRIADVADVLVAEVRRLRAIEEAAEDMSEALRLLVPGPNCFVSKRIASAEAALLARMKYRRVATKESP